MVRVIVVADARISFSIGIRRPRKSQPFLLVVMLLIVSLKQRRLTVRDMT